jgi:hypothetical protein
VFAANAITEESTSMKISNTIAGAALALLAAAGTHAETYDGVHALTSGNKRSDVGAQAVAATRAPDLFSDGAMSRPAARVNQRERSAVRGEAVATAHAPNQNMRRESFPNSMIPSSASAQTRQASR